MYTGIKYVRRRKKLCDALTVIFGVCAFAGICLAIGFAEADNYYGAYGIAVLTAMCGIATGIADVYGGYYDHIEKGLLVNGGMK